MVKPRPCIAPKAMGGSHAIDRQADVMDRTDRCQPPWHGLAAGCVAGACGVLVGHAFDTAKVQAQVGKAAVITKPSQLLRLYRGVLPPLLTTGAMRALYFGVYETIRPAVADARKDLRQDSLQTVFLAGAATGLVVAPVTAPMQRLKLVQQMAPLSLGQSISGLLRGQGIRGLFRGLGLHCALETIGSACCEQLRLGIHAGAILPLP